jgi:hypothetical protein
MGEILGGILAIILLVLYFCAVLAGLFVVLWICAAAIAVGAFCGVWFGVVLGVKNYFAALFSQVKLEQY